MATAPSVAHVRQQLAVPGEGLTLGLSGGRCPTHGTSPRGRRAARRTPAATDQCFGGARASHSWNQGPHDAIAARSRRAVLGMGSRGIVKLRTMRLNDPQDIAVESCPAPGTSRTHLTARGESPPAFDRRCIPPGCVAPRSHTAGIFPRRALSDRRITGLGATRDFHHGLLGGCPQRDSAHPRPAHLVRRPQSHSRTCCPAILAGSAPGLGTNFCTRPANTSAMYRLPSWSVVIECGPLKCP